MLAVLFISSAPKARTIHLFRDYYSAHSGMMITENKSAQRNNNNYGRVSVISRHLVEGRGGSNSGLCVHKLRGPFAAASTY